MIFYTSMTRRQKKVIQNVKAAEMTRLHKCAIMQILSEKC